LQLPIYLRLTCRLSSRIASAEGTICVLHYTETACAKQVRTNMETVKNSTPHGRPSYQLPESTESAMPQSPATPSNPTSFDTLTPLAGPTSWLQAYSSLGYQFMIPDQSSIDGTRAQQGHFGFLPRDHSPSSYPFNQTLPQVTAPNAAVGGRRKSQADRDEAPRPERKNTKRRRTGPDRFGNYLHGDVALPLDTTTADVFKKYPNHITDEDIVSSLHAFHLGSIFRISWFEGPNPEPASSYLTRILRKHCYESKSY
jgi:hypothetical protein